jgi:mRNA interferase MazF
VRRGEIWLADLDPVVGTEAAKTRPVIIISNDAANTACEQHRRGVLTVVPITSNVNRVYTFQVLLRRGTAGLREDSKAQTEQVRAVDVARMRHRLGVVPPRTLARIEAALRSHLLL